MMFCSVPRTAAVDPNRPVSLPETRRSIQWNLTFNTPNESVLSVLGHRTLDEPLALPVGAVNSFKPSLHCRSPMPAPTVQ
jgi:hypothetical protein